MELIKSKSQNSIIQQRKELFWAKIFCNYINNSSTGFDYEVQSLSTDTIDAKCISRSGKYPELEMQLTWVKETEFNPKKSPTKYLLFRQDYIEEAIVRKTKDYTKRNENVNNIILLLQGYMAKPWAKDILTDAFCSKYKTNPFNGIYYLVRPSVGLSEKEDSKNGSVIPIKACF